MQSRSVEKKSAAEKTDCFGVEGFASVGELAGRGVAAIS